MSGLPNWVVVAIGIAAILIILFLLGVRITITRV